MAYHIELFYQISKIKESEVPFTFPRVSWKRKPNDLEYGCMYDRYSRDPVKALHVYEMWVVKRPDDEHVMELFESYKWQHLEELSKVIRETVSKAPDRVYRTEKIMS